MKHKNLPIFIPHLGCPNQCTFCNQHAITHTAVPTPSQVATQIAAMLQTVDPIHCDIELAFFGGSFTALPKDRMLAYLEAAKPFDFASIRISTRPDAIDREILDLLQSYRVTHIELGIQSTDDAVLERCKRGHTAKQSETACRLIREQGFHLGGQMMIGLPGASPQSEVQTALDLCAFGAEECRIYPLSVFAHTPLARELAQGTFLPLSLSESITRSADVLEIFSSRSVSVLRIGLCETDTLQNEILGGVYHPAFGELVLGEVFYRQLHRLFSQTPPPPDCTVRIPRGCTSCAVGQKKENRLRLCKEFALHSLRFEETDGLQGFACELQTSTR